MVRRMLVGLVVGLAVAAGSVWMWWRLIELSELRALKRRHGL